MHRNKKDVDKHVESLMFKLSPKDFKTRAYSIARLYFEVGDFRSCQKYAELYLAQKANNAAAHKLLGQAFQKLGEKEKALEQFKTSFDIDPTHTATILDICEILADDEIVIDSGRTKFWCCKAEANFPEHPITFRLREKLLAVADPDPESLVKLLKSELEVRPKDAILHTRLLKHYLSHNRYIDAFDHSCYVEFDKNFFSNNIAWYETLSEILKYNSIKANDWLYQLLLLTVREKLCVLSLTEIQNVSKNLTECVDYLHSYDQALESVVKSGSPPGSAEFYNSLIKHHQGQLVFHVATYLLKRAKKDHLNWKDAKKFSVPLMLLAWQNVDSSINSLPHIPERQKNVIRRWYIEGSFRCSQSGHYLLAVAQEKSQILLDQISQLCSSTNWKDKLYKMIFTSPVHLEKITSSYLASNLLNSPSLRLPRKAEVQGYDENAQREYPNSLHHFVWMLLNYKTYTDFKCTMFDMLIKETTICGPETLNKMDVLAFLFCSSLTAQQQRDKINYMNIEKPFLPANITDLLCTLPQMKWWDCAYKLSQNELGTEYTDIRTTLSRGIEIVRCIDNHGLDPVLLNILGRTFAELAKSSKNIEEKTQFEIRSCLYYSSSIPFLEKLKKKVFIKLPEKRMFNYVHEELEPKKLNYLLEESKMYVALSHLNDGEYEKAINLLSTLKLPEAFYHLSRIYKDLALEDKKNYNDDNAEAKYTSLLGKAKTFAYKSLEQIKNIELYKEKHLYSDIQELISEIETYMNKFDPELSMTLNNDTSDENGSMEDVGSMRNKANVFRNTSSTPKQVLRRNNVNSTAYRTAIDSQIFDNSQADHLYLERIEKQIKNLQKRDSSINDFMEQTKDWFEENRKLGSRIISTINSNIENTTEQFKLLKISVDQVKEQIDECRKECKDVVELKKQISDLKKEVNKLKKTSDPTIDESDILSLDEEYRSNENTSTFGTNLPFATPQILPQFAQRFMPPFSVPSNPYQLYGQNFYNLYNQYTQFGQSAAPPIFDPSRVQMNYPGIFPTPDQVYLEAAHLANTTVPGGANVAPAPPQNIHNTSSIPPVSIAPVSSSKSTTKIDTKDTSKSLPVNVVITSSDPLPTCPTTPAPVLSVTIPQQHIKGPHNYQIQMPQSTESKTTPFFHFPSTGNKPTSTTISSATINWNTKPIFMTNNKPENILPVQDKSGEPESSKIVDGIFSGISPNTSLNKSRTLSEKSNTSIENYDPCPDFKPIIPLPAEIKVTTGEEDEEVIFNARAKLYRFSDKQWKERGVGEMKLLKHKITGKVRVLMRREQVHKICANHIISPEMEIKPMKNETKAYFWVANDFAEETVILEKFCIRFKTADIAREYFEAFENARKESVNQSLNMSLNKNVQEINKANVTTSINTSDNVKQSAKTVVGGFIFSSQPSFKTADNDTIRKQTAEVPTTKLNIFNDISFKTTTSPSFSKILNISNSTGNEPDVKSSFNSSTNTNKLNTSDTVEEFESTAEFKPVVPLPALVDQKTGEEDEIILFEHRAKLLRFDANGKEWKERGLGNIKLLVNKDNNQKLRLLMRREQIMKVCCNHAVTKEMTFQKMPNIDKAVTWCAKDFSEGELVAETFCLRFKTVQACNDFMEAIKNAQSAIGDDTKAAKEEKNAAKQHSSAGFGDMFKPKPGSWACEACYTNNLESFIKCACCETPNPQKVVTGNNNCSNTANSSNWGDKFKPKPGSWECKECFIRNEAYNNSCVACNSAKDSSATNNANAENAPKFNLFNTSSNEPKFTFGIPQNSITTSNPSANPLGFATSGTPKFSFGINQNKTVTFGTSSTAASASQSFINAENDSAKPINFGLKNKEEESSIIATPTKPALLATPKTNIATFGQDKGSFKFSFKPKSPAKGKSPSKSPKDKSGEDSDENEYASEDEGHNIHFSPVIPMPDKIDVVTGEENEDELYGHRAKLFIFNTGEWKERGIGLVKILKHKETGKLRVVMRREQVHKICLNHALGPDIIYKRKDEKTWLFAANDFSDGEIILQNFCLRFQNKEVSSQFKEAIDEAITKKYGNQHTDKGDGNKDTDEDNVIFIREIQATNEEKQKAKKLMLPENFYTYKIKEPCQGCRGCSDDDHDSKSESEKTTFNTVKSLLKQDLNTTPSKTTTFSFQSPSNSVYGTPNIFDKTVDTTIFRTPLSANGSTTTSTGTSPTSSNSSLLYNMTSDKENTLTNKTITPVNPVKPVPFVIGNQSQGASTILAAPKLITGPTSSNSTEDAKSVFGFTEQKSIFGENKISQSSNNSIFGFNPQFQTKTSTQDGGNKSIFSVNYKQAPTSSQPMFGIFGGAASTFTFGTSSQTNQDNAKSTFGKVENTSIFNNKSDSSLFNKSLENPSNIDTSEKFMFGKNVILQNKESDKSPLNSKPCETPEVVIKNLEHIFTSTNKENNDKNSVSETQKICKETPKVDETLLFTALSSSAPEFSIQKKMDFKWEGAGQQLFTSISKKDDRSENADNSGVGAEEEYDPHYEPIVPLPDKIVVTTGEEDEEKLFGERCKLYRYDDKTREWKERGVGEMKLLYHPQKNSYRLLLRREQVHKAVLNMLIFKDLELLPMKNSDRAWTWFGRNYAEIAGEQETLAVRFKSVNLATDFHNKVMDCVRKLQVAAAEAIKNEKESKEQQSEKITPLRLPKHLQPSGRNESPDQPVEKITPLRLPKHLDADDRAINLIGASIQPSVIKETHNVETKKSDTEPIKSESQSVSELQQQHESEEQQDREEEEEEGDYDEDYEHGYDHNEDSEGYYNEDDESTVYYPCKAVISQGNTQTTCETTHVKVSFDMELYSPKILVTDSNTGEILADMLIHTNTEFQLSEDTCTWTGTDYTSAVSVEKTLSVTFTNSETAMEFYDSCETSKAATYDNASSDSES